jgi:hypothetical protein
MFMAEVLWNPALWSKEKRARVRFPEKPGMNPSGFNEWTKGDSLKSCGKPVSGRDSPPA